MTNRVLEALMFCATASACIILSGFSVQVGLSHERDKHTQAFCLCLPKDCGFRVNRILAHLVGSSHVRGDENAWH
jgi:hypothetical protein